MNRIINVAIAGKEYPLSFSLGAAKKIANKYGSLEKAFAGISAEEEMTSNMLETFIFILETLIKQGCEYERMFDDKEIKPITAVEIENVINVSDIEQVTGTIIEALSSSQQKEIETKTEQKNVKAPKAI